MRNAHMSGCDGKIGHPASLPHTSRMDLRSIRRLIPLAALPPLLLGCLATPQTLPLSTTPTFDLDGDGTVETALRVGHCKATTGTDCLELSSLITGRYEIPLPGPSAPCPAPILADHIADIGDHAGDALHEIAVVNCRRGGQTERPVLSILDVRNRKIIAQTTAPDGQNQAYWNWPHDADGHRYPFLAPGYGDGLPTAERPIWGHICLFQPMLPSDSRCGEGFVRIEAKPAPEFFREYGGYLQDLDGDGWEDIHLIYHRLQYSISTRTGLPLAITEYDIAAATEPAAPTWFHAGRNYGAHVSGTSPDGAPRTLMVGGVPVGSFQDMNCNVTRYIGLLETPPGRPGERRLKWSHYYGFASSTFGDASSEPTDPFNPLVARAADYLNGCLHYPGDARSLMGAEPIILVNRFEQDSPVARCLWEQHQLYLPPTWTKDKQAAWYGCFNQNLHSHGTWSVQVLREEDGRVVTIDPARYLWGRSNRLLPAGEAVYVTEPLPPDGHPFDLRRLPTPRLTLRSLEQGRWIERGTLPIDGRPKFQWLRGSGHRGHGSSSYFLELIEDDVDGDGLAEFQLDDGTWVGWSQQSADWAIKLPPSTPTRAKESDSR